jgi:3-methylfumaryl-CoA hydratase
MTDMPGLDVDVLRRWIGRTETARDMVSLRLVRELQATLDENDAETAIGDAAPLAMHWCLAPPVVTTSALGPDGHPARGGFLPPVPLPRRMWAGSTLRLKDRLRVGDAVERCSRIADVSVKDGRTGVLCFVTVDHEISTDRGLAIAERQNIVYRALGPGGGTSTAQSVQLPAPPAEAAWHRDLKANPVLLFRYSALTFNGHRIHYDRSYATDEEGHPGLIVHGPLQATLLLEYAASIRGSAPQGFTFRGLQPLFDFMPFRLCAKETGAALGLWIQNGEGACTMEAEARW